MAWKIWSYASKDGEDGEDDEDGEDGEDSEEVSFKCSNLLLCCISTVHVRRDKLELNFPPVSNGCLVLLAKFIVQNM